MSFIRVSAPVVFLCLFCSQNTIQKQRKDSKPTPCSFLDHLGHNDKNKTFGRRVSRRWQVVNSVGGILYCCMDDTVRKVQIIKGRIQSGMQASKMTSVYVVAGDVKTSGKRAKQNPKSATKSATPPTCFRSTGTAARARGRLLSAKSDAETLVADVENTLSDLFVNCLSRLDKRVVNIVCGLCTGLQEHQAVFFCECLALLGSNLPLLLQITLVTNKHDGHVVVRVLPRVF